MKKPAKTGSANPSSSRNSTSNPNNSNQTTAIGAKDNSNKSNNFSFIVRTIAILLIIGSYYYGREYNLPYNSGYVPSRIEIPHIKWSPDRKFAQVVSTSIGTTIPYLKALRVSFYHP
ncbi:hypothetical protein HMI54_010591 [Coelomomyces lativittatus]|nr:hypothetical protein HMI54_010591 [Coelomomyces lativittatus]